MTQDEIDRYFETHIPYRLKLLLEFVDNNTASPVGGSHAHFIASIITGRLLLSFLGIGKDRDAPILGEYPKRGSDVLVTHLGGETVKLDTLNTETQEKLYAYIVMADKAAAHLTKEKEHNYQAASEIAHLIFNLLQQHLYTKTNRPCPSFTSLGFTNLASNANEVP